MARATAPIMTGQGRIGFHPPVAGGGTGSRAIAHSSSREKLGDDVGADNPARTEKRLLPGRWRLRILPIQDTRSRRVSYALCEKNTAPGQRGRTSHKGNALYSGPCACGEHRGDARRDVYSRGLVVRLSQNGSVGGTLLS